MHVVWPFFAGLKPTSSMSASSVLFALSVENARGAFLWVLSAAPSDTVTDSEVGFDAGLATGVNVGWLGFTEVAAEGVAL